MRCRALACVGGALAWLAASAGAADAQVLSGLVLEAGNDRPVSFAEVTILNDTGSVVQETFSDGSGAFSASLPRAGGYQIYAVRLGYYAAVSGFIDVVVGENIAVAVRLQPKPFESDSLTVEVASRVTPLERVGFYDRMQSGVGSFFGPTEIERIPGARGIPDIIREAPGVRIATDNYGKDRVTLRNTMGGSCLPSLILDGVGIEPPWETIVDLEDVDGLEVYSRPVQVPARFYGLIPTRDRQASAAAQCGIVVVWTKQGNARRR
jgi:hypothetical protein